MPKPRYKTTNGKQYNQALINRSSPTFWIDEDAMYRIKYLRGGTLRMRNDNAQVGETYTMIKALNKLIVLFMPETQHIVQYLNSHKSSAH